MAGEAGAKVLLGGAGALKLSVLDVEFKFGTALGFDVGVLIVDLEIEDGADVVADLLELVGVEANAFLDGAGFALETVDLVIDEPTVVVVDGSAVVDFDVILIDFDSAMRFALFAASDAEVFVLVVTILFDADKFVVDLVAVGVF